MAKERWQKAWEFFVGEFTGEGPIYPKNRWGGYSKKVSRQRDQRSDRLFWDLVGVLEDFGIQTLRHKDLGKSRDAEKKEFTVGGTWNNNPKKPTVNLLYNSPSILAHEFTHALDYLERGWSFRPSSELVACAGGYLIVCHFVGFRSPSDGIDYARRQGANRHTLRSLDEYIPRLFWIMTELIEEQRNKEVRNVV